MEHKKLAFLFATMAVVFLATIQIPTAFAARKEVVPFSLYSAEANIRNPFANIFMVGQPAENCVDKGKICAVSTSCCAGCYCSMYSSWPPLGVCLGSC